MLDTCIFHLEGEGGGGGGSKDFGWITHMACNGIRGESVFASRVERVTMENRFSLGSIWGGHWKIKETKILQPPQGGGVGGARKTLGGSHTWFVVGSGGESVFASRVERGNMEN